MKKDGFIIRRALSLLMSVALLTAACSSGAIAVMDENASDEQPHSMTVANYNRITGETTYREIDLRPYQESAEQKDQATRVVQACLPDSYTAADEQLSEQNQEAKGISSWNTVDNVNAFPYSAVVTFCVSYQGDLTAYTATGFIVGPDVVLTAAHVLFGSKAGVVVDDVTIYRHQNSGTLDTTKLEPWVTCYYPSNYPTTYSKNEDWAIVIMQNNLQAMCGCFGFGTAESISNKSVSLSGYPTDMKYRQKYATGGTMDSSGDYRMKHDYEPYQGHSGSPLYDSDYIVWGIHTTSDSLLVRASGIRLHRELFDMIVENVDAGRLKYGYTS